MRSVSLYFSGVGKWLHICWLLFHAARLGVITQRLCDTTLPLMIAKLVTIRFLPKQVSSLEARQATLRSCTRLGRWFGMLDSCLVRSLVLATLLSDQKGVKLHLGFRPEATGQDVAGHAWVSLQGAAVLNPEVSGLSYTECVVLPILRVPHG